MYSCALTQIRMELLRWRSLRKQLVRIPAYAKDSRRWEFLSMMPKSCSASWTQKEMAPSRYRSSLLAVLKSEAMKSVAGTQFLRMQVFDQSCIGSIIQDHNLGSLVQRELDLKLSRELRPCHQMPRQRHQLRTT